MQSCLYHKTRVIESPFHVRQCRVEISDFSIHETHHCQLLFAFNLSLTGRDSNIVYDDIEQEFRRLETKLLSSNEMNRLARIDRQIRFHFHDPKQHDLLCGQRRTCLTYESKTKISCSWLLTENTFWIMTCIGFSWLFRTMFAYMVAKLTVPVYIELEGTMPRQQTMTSREET